MTIISNGQDQASLANSQRATQDLHSKANSINSLQTRLMPQQDKDKKLREACEGFETIFVKKMWEEMQATIQESDFLKGRDEKHWRSMYNQELAETLSKAGGIGLADMMYKQLSGNLADATRATVTTSFGGNKSGFELKPVPLFNSTDIAQKADTSQIIQATAPNVPSVTQNITTNPMPQNSKSMYSSVDIQPKAQDLEAIRNQSIKNANDAVAGMGSNPSTKIDANYDNSKIVQNMLEQLNTKNNGKNQATNAKTAAHTIVALQEQNSATNVMHSPNVNNMQQNHVLQPNLNTQPIRTNAYTQPIIHKVGGDAVLPSSTKYTQAMNRTRTKLPEQTSIYQAQVHGNPGISPSKYVHNSPFVVKANDDASKRSNEQVALDANNINTNNNAQTATSLRAMQNQEYIPINAQNISIGQGQNTQLRQNLNVLPSERKTNTI